MRNLLLKFFFIRFNRNFVIRDTSNTQYDELTFGKFFAIFRNLFFDLMNSNFNEKKLYKSILSNLNSFLNRFIFNFLNFNNYIKNFVY